MDVLSVSDQATGDKIDNRGGSCCKNEAIDPRLGLNLQLKESSFWRHEMELYHHLHHHARNGALGYYYCPFTNAQLKELERQAMVYKYMMASIPIPLDLLVSSSASPYDGRNVKFGLKGGDSEPGRCRRTDGKKWRCSKDVVPHHKYCERHLHRGRTRSGKPVETSSTSQILPYGRCNKKSSNSNSSEKKDGSFDPLAASMLYSYRGDPRSFHWEMLKGEIFPAAAPTEQQPNGRAASMLTGNYNNLSCSGTGQQDNQYLNFIDVWSSGASLPDEQGSNPVSGTSVSDNGNLSISSLDLSMGGNNKFGDDEMGPGMGLGVVGSCQDPAGCCITSSEMSSWLAPVVAATPGGPLAEILRPSPVATPAAEHPPSPNIVDGGSHGLKVTTPSSSSSSEVMKTTASLSDSSGSQS